MRFPKLKRAISGLLAATMLLTTPLTAFAGRGDSASGNTGANITVTRGGDWSAEVNNSLTSGKIGLRFALVDRTNPEKVISVDDSGKPMVVDLLYVTEDAWRHQTTGNYNSILNDEYKFISVKTQPNMNMKVDGDKQTVYQVFWPEISEWFDCPGQEMPPWIIHNSSTGSFESNGEQLVSWLKNNDLGQQVVGDDGSIFTTVSIYGYPVQMESAVKDNNSTIEVKNHLTGAVNTYPANDSTIIEKANKLINDFGNNRIIGPGSAYGTEEFEQSVQFLFSESTSILTALDTMLTVDGVDKTTVQDRKDRLMLAMTNFMGRDPSLSVLLENYTGDAPDKAGPMALAQQLTVEKIADMFGIVPSEQLKREEATDGINLSTIGTSNSAEAGSSLENIGFDELDKDSEQESHVYRILKQRSESGAPLFQTPSMLESRQGNKEEKTLATCDEDWVLLVEPIVWLSIHPRWDFTTMIHTKLYGTITNLTYAFNNEADIDLQTGKKLADYKDRDTFNVAALNYAVWYSLSVADQGFTFSLPEGASPDEIPLVLTDLQHTTTKRLFGTANNGLMNGLNKDVARTVYVEDPNGGITIGNKTYRTETRTSNTLEGYGVLAFWGKEISGNVPVPTTTIRRDKPEPDSTGIKVAKWYVYQERDEAGNVISEHTANVHVGSLDKRYTAVVNEPGPNDESVWLVQKWGTGQDSSAVPTDGDLNSTFEEYYQKSPGHYGGTTPNVVDLTNEPDEKVIYVKLIMAEIIPEESSSDDITIIKVFEPSDGTPPTVEEETIPKGTPEYNANEPDWTYEEDIQTPDPKVPVSEWPDVPTSGDPGNNPQIPVNPDTSTIYIRYSEAPDFEENKLVLYENELSYHFESLSELSGTTLVPLVIDGEQVLDALGEPMYVPAALLATLTETFADMSGDVDLCDTEHYRDGCSCGGWDDYCDCDDPECGGCESDPICDGHYGVSTSRQIVDDSYTLHTTSANPPENFIKDFREKGSTWSKQGTLGISGGTTENLSPDAEYTLFRNKNKDVVTLYPGKNDSGIKSSVVELGITAESYEPRDTRIASEFNGSFYDDFVTHFIDATQDREMSWEWICSETGNSEASDTWESTPDKDYGSLNDPYSQPDNVVTYYELGKTNTATAVPEKTINSSYYQTLYNKLIFIFSCRIKEVPA